MQFETALRVRARDIETDCFRSHSRNDSLQDKWAAVANVPDLLTFATPPLRGSRHYSRVDSLYRRGLNGRGRSIWALIRLVSLTVYKTAQVSRGLSNHVERLTLATVLLHVSISHAF